MIDYKIVQFYSLNDTIQELIREAVKMRKRAYCPYSNFAVGAAILTEDDSKVYSACNIENAAYSPCICAERGSTAKAVSDGYTKFKMVAIVGDQLENFTAPCGVCRQVLSEFCGSDCDMEVYLAKPTMDQVLCTKLSELLPLAFELDQHITL